MEDLKVGCPRFCIGAGVAGWGTGTILGAVTGGIGGFGGIAPKGGGTIGFCIGGTETGVIMGGFITGGIGGCGIAGLGG
jgi:hypothetical protein